MAELPKERLQESPPFTYVGLDLFGPFIVKRGWAEVKRYGKSPWRHLGETNKISTCYSYLSAKVSPSCADRWISTNVNDKSRRHPQLQTTYCRSHQWCQQSSTFDVKYAAYSNEGHHASSRIIQFHRHVQSQTMEENTTSSTGVLVMVAKRIFGNTSGAREMEKAQKKPSNRWHDLTERRNWTSELANGTCYWSISRQPRSCTFGEDQDGK